MRGLTDGGEDLPPSCKMWMILAASALLQHITDHGRIIAFVGLGDLSAGIQLDNHIMILIVEGINRQGDDYDE